MTPENPLENKIAVDAKKKTQEQDRQLKQHVPPESTDPKSKPPATHYGITCKTERNWWDKAKPFVECVGVILLGIYPFYTIEMYCANKKAADAATSAAETASRSLVETNRSWIEIRLGGEKDKPRTIKEILASTKSLSMPLVFTNIGRFPIKNIEIEGSIEVVNSNEPVSFHPASTHYKGSHGREGMSILFPNRSSDFLAAAFQKNPTGPMELLELGETDRKSLADGSKYLMVYARGTYSDAFGKHWAEFCEPIFFVAGGQGKYGDCINYNDAGDGDMPND
jgi:hypothetical protein